MQLVVNLFPSPPSSISSSHSGSSRSRLSFLSTSSSSTFSDISVSSLPSPPPHSASKTNAFFGSPFPTRPPSPTPPPSSKTNAFFAIPAIDITAPTVVTPTTKSIVQFSDEPTPRPKDREPDLTWASQPAPPTEPAAGSLIAHAPNTSLRLLKALGHGAFSSVWLAEDHSPVPLVLRSRRSLRDLRRQASLKSPDAPSRAGSLRKLRARVPGTRPIRSRIQPQEPPGLLGASLSRTSSARRQLTVSIVDPTPDAENNPTTTPTPTSTMPGATSLKRTPSMKGRLVAVKMTLRSCAGGDQNDPEWERENERTRVAFVREVEVLRHISHPNITPLLTHLTTPTHHVLVLPFLPGGDLLALLNSDAAWARLRESVLQRIWAELCRAVAWMHSVGIVHRDVKLETLNSTSAPPTLDDLPPTPAPLIKLTDFGLSRFIDIRTDEERARDRAARSTASTSSASSSSDSDTDNDKEEQEQEDGPLLSTRCGSEAYAAPELVMGGAVGGTGRRGGVYDARETDAWACGVVLYALVVRRLPFGEGTAIGAGAGMMARRAWLMQIARGEYEWPDVPDVETEAGCGLVEGERKDGEGEELVGPNLIKSAGARRIVARLLVRNPRKRARVAELWGDVWMGGEGVDMPTSSSSSSSPPSSSSSEPDWDALRPSAQADAEGDVEDGELLVLVNGVYTGDGEGEGDADGLEEGGVGVDDVLEGEDLELALEQAEAEVDEFGLLVDQDGIDDIARREVV
ncbi:hypothetical protein H0H81_010205 [Sphagnurus paluster]|uniref:non-specific serine/threonine protein kinase n=1 Tax=Sphagnurus paluster TaxID=117069 RepID=A0A9P7FUX4_9AGAR|nr:hypothetical protein H0H81_010205 [Sphagnurus paluster]